MNSKESHASTLVESFKGIEDSVFRFDMATPCCEPAYQLSMCLPPDPPPVFFSTAFTELQGLKSRHLSRDLWQSVNTHIHTAHPQHAGSSALETSYLRCCFLSNKPVVSLRQQTQSVKPQNGFAGCEKSQFTRPQQ